jgi:hypothetical protein
LLGAACSHAGIGRPSDGREGILLLGVRAPDDARDWVASMVRDQVRNWDANRGWVHGWSARLSRRDRDWVGCSAHWGPCERVDICRYGALVGGLLLQAAFGEDGFSSFIGCHGLLCLDISFFLVHSMLFLGVEAVVVVNALHLFFLLEELKLFQHWVHVVNVGDGAMEVSIVVSGIGHRGAPSGVGGWVFDHGEAGLAAFELFLYHG